MKKSNEKIIIEALKEHEAGIPATKISKKLGVSLKAFYYWKSLYSGMSEHKLRQYKELIAENKRLKRRCEEYARLVTGITDITNINKQDMHDRKTTVKYLMKEYNVSIMLACKYMNLSRSAFYYEGRKGVVEE